MGSSLKKQTKLNHKMLQTEDSTNKTKDFACQTQFSSDSEDCSTCMGSSSDGTSSDYSSSNDCSSNETTPARNDFTCNGTNNFLLMIDAYNASTDSYVISSEKDASENDSNCHTKRKFLKTKICDKKVSKSKKISKKPITPIDSLFSTESEDLDEIPNCKVQNGSKQSNLKRVRLLREAKLEKCITRTQLMKEKQRLKSNDRSSSTPDQGGNDRSSSTPDQGVLINSDKRHLKYTPSGDLNSALSSTPGTSNTSGTPLLLGSTKTPESGVISGLLNTPIKRSRKSETPSKKRKSDKFSVSI
jgi:hypothetical protein